MNALVAFLIVLGFMVGLDFAVSGGTATASALVMVGL